MSVLTNELLLDFNGVDVNRTLDIEGETYTFALDGVPDFGLFQPRENRQDQGVLGLWPVGQDGVEPRRIQFMVKAEIPASFTDPVDRHRAARMAHDALRQQFSPKLGHVSFGITTKDSGGNDQRVDILARATTADSFRITTQADRAAPGARPSGYVLYLVQLDCLWPWFRGPEQSVEFDTDSETIYPLAAAIGGDRRVGWRVEVASGSGTVASLTVAWGSLALRKVVITPLAVSPGTIQQDQAFDWFYTLPQDWKSYQHDGADPPTVSIWGALQPGPGSNSGLAAPEDDEVLIAAAPAETASVAGTLYYRAYYENIFPAVA